MKRYTVSAYCHNKLLAQEEIVESSPSRAIAVFKMIRSGFCDDTVIAAVEKPEEIEIPMTVYSPPTSLPKLSVYLVTGETLLPGEPVCEIITASNPHLAKAAFKERYRVANISNCIFARKLGRA